ncbi:hypothetical protein [Caenimonas soli]|uniref:hypothetical protein n=1 Tax=Caenimonas soli TaxID=2735555 RepID=UPI001553485F|nr:hypothetical protein [Caenimonas soli]NPC57800.1 hypothetical protein [Caenimonas soli]
MDPEESTVADQAQPGRRASRGAKPARRGLALASPLLEASDARSANRREGVSGWKPFGGDDARRLDAQHDSAPGRRARATMIWLVNMSWARRRVVEMGIDMDWVVRLGREEWQRFTYERSEGSPLRLLGSVRRGAAIGALAADLDGNYLQVNGDHVSPLNNAQLRRAVAVAKTADWTPTMPARHRQSRVPVVVIKRRRVLPSTDAAKVAVS